MAVAGDSATVPEIIVEPVIAKTLGLNPLQLRELDPETLHRYLGCAQGEQVGLWAQHNPPEGQDGHG